MYVLLIWLLVVKHSLGWPSVTFSCYFRSWRIDLSFTVRSLYIFIHVFKINVSHFSFLSMAAFFHVYCSLFPSQPCEQGKKLKRIHWVANVGTALKFLEGRKVRVQCRLFYAFLLLFFSISSSSCSVRASWAQILNLDLQWPPPPHTRFPHKSLIYPEASIFCFYVAELHFVG